MNLKFTLRPLTRDDSQAFMSWGGDPVVTQPLFWDAYQEEAQAAEFLKQVAEKHPWFMAICIENQPVGAITLDRGAGRGSCRAELGYVVARAQWGNGIATAAVKQALERGFKDLDIKRIEATVDPENGASIKVLQRAGFVREGLLENYVIHRGAIRDRYVYAKTIK
jgi:RimJ/RimL family protein N-acetyltransferase